MGGDDVGRCVMIGVDVVYGGVGQAKVYCLSGQER